MPKSVTVYSKPGCVQCRFTVKELVAKGVPHTVIDVTKDADARKHLEDLGLRTMPVVEIQHQDGKPERWFGLKVDKLRGLQHA